MGTTLFTWLMKVLEVFFFAGLIGSAVVILITFVEDGQLLLESDQPSGSNSVQNTEGVPKVRSALRT